MNVPTYLLARNVHGPVSPAPQNCESLLKIDETLKTDDNFPFKRVKLYGKSNEGIFLFLSKQARLVVS